MIVSAAATSSGTLGPLIWVFAGLFAFGIVLLILTSVLSLINRISRRDLASSIEAVAKLTRGENLRDAAADAVFRLNHQVLYRAITIGSLSADPNLRRSVLDNRSFLTLPLLAIDDPLATHHRTPEEPPRV